MTEERYYAIATGLVDPSTISNEEREAFVKLYAKPTTTTVDILARIHKKAAEEILNIEEEIKTLQDCKAALKKAQKDAEEGMLRYCSDIINTRITKGFTFTVKESKAADIINEDAIPEEYQTKEEIIKINKALILNDLKLDKEIPGAELKINKKVKFEENGGY